MGIKISDMTPDASIGGAELIPVSDAGAARSVTIAGIKSYVVDAIEAVTAGTAVTGTDSVFILQGGALKPVDIDLVAQHAINTVWGKAAETVVDAADIIPLKDGGTTEKTVTAAILAAYILGAIKASVLDVSTLDPATLGTGDYLLVTQGTTAKKTTLSAINAAIYAALAAHVVAATAAPATADADMFYVVKGTTPYKMTLAQIATHIGGGVAGSGAANALAQWSATDTLKTGPTLALIADLGSDSDSVIPTTGFVEATLAARKIDDFAAAEDNTDLDASTTAHGLLLKATAPAATLRNIVAIDNTETAYTNKALFDATLPGAVGTGAAGSAMTASRRDHVHDALPYVAVDGTLATGANADFAPVKLVYAKTCTDSDGDDVIDLHDGTIIGQIVTVHLSVKSGSDNAVITPVTALSYSTITLDAATKIATLQWQGAVVGWAILYTNGTVA